MRTLNVVVLAFASVVGGLACGPRERVLVPQGGVVTGREEREESCYLHHVLLVRASRDQAAAWATDLGLACEPDGGSPCSHWSKAATGEAFWRERVGVLQGFDTLDARYDGDVLRVDHGVYTCSR